MEWQVFLVNLLYELNKILKKVFRTTEMWYTSISLLKVCFFCVSSIVLFEWYKLSNEITLKCTGIKLHSCIALITTHLWNVNEIGATRQLTHFQAQNTNGNKKTSINRHFQLTLKFFLFAQMEIFILKNV